MPHLWWSIYSKTLFTNYFIGIFQMFVFLQNLFDSHPHNVSYHRNLLTLTLEMFFCINLWTLIFVMLSVLHKCFDAHPLNVCFLLKSFDTHPRNVCLFT